MRLISIKSKIRRCISSMFLVTLACVLRAQTSDSSALRLSLEEAIRYTKTSNKLIKVFRTEENAALQDLHDAKLAALPQVASSASYQRYTDITLFDGVLGSSHQIPKPPNPNAGALAVEAAFNLYSGGRQKALVADMKGRTELAAIDTREQEATITLQVTLQYLDLIRLYYQKQLISDQVTRAQLRSKNIAAFYANGKVTKSDVLRAEVLLSNALLSADANKNDYRIGNQKLNTLLNMDELTRIIPADTALLMRPDSTPPEKLLLDFSGTYAILKIRKNIELQENRINFTRSFNRPSVTLFGGYGLNYPNTLVFPPVAQTFAVGLVGVKFTYNISSQYHNKYKVRSARLRETKLREQQDWIEDNVKEEANALVIKYNEAVNRVLVIQKTIEQAESNYNIQNNKYLNQLSLLTDLLEADDLFQETRLNYVQANIAALAIYYRLLFITGKL